MKAVIRVLIFAMMLVSMSANADRLEISSTDNVKDVIKHARKELDEFMRNASSQLRFLMMFAFQGADAQIQNLANIYANAEGKTIKDLSQAERQMFIDLQNTFNNIETRMSQPVNKAIDTFANFNTALAQFTVGHPLITRYGPVYIAPAKYADKQGVKISVKGYKLCTGERERKISLKIGSNEYPAEECVNEQISFLVPREVFPSEETDLKIATAKLKIHYPERAWYSPFNKEKAFEFRLMFDVLPNKLGKITYHTVHGVPRNDPPEYYVSPEPASTYTHDGDRGVSPPKCFSLDRSKGRKFDWANARTADHVSGDESEPIGYSEIVRVPGDEYTLCVIAYASIRDKHRWASNNAYLVTNTVRDGIDWDMQSNEEPKDLGWDDEYFHIPENASEQIMFVSLLGDPMRIITPETTNELAPFLSVIPSPSNKIVVIHPEKKW